MRPDFVEVHELAVVLGLFVGPDFLHGLDALAAYLPAPVERRAVVLHLLGVPAAADAEDQPAVGQLVHGRHFVGHRDRVALDHQTDAAADLDRVGHRGRGGQRDEQVVRMPVFLGQVAAARKRALAAGRNVSVFREPDRLEAARLALLGERVRSNGIVGGEHRDPDFHNVLLGLLGVNEGMKICVLIAWRSAEVNAAGAPDYGTSTSLPTDWRDSMCRCAAAASASGNVRPIRSLSLPSAMWANEASIPVRCRSGMAETV